MPQCPTKSDHKGCDRASGCDNADADNAAAACLPALLMALVMVTTMTMPIHHSLHPLLAVGFSKGLLPFCIYGRDDQSKGAFLCLQNAQCLLVAAAFCLLLSATAVMACMALGGPQYTCSICPCIV